MCRVMLSKNLWAEAKILYSRVKQIHITSNPVVLGVNTCFSSEIPTDRERERGRERHKKSKTIDSWLWVWLVTEATGILLTPVNCGPIAGVKPRSLREDNQPRL